MKIHVEFLSLPIVAKMVGGKSISLDFPGGTVDDLIKHLTGRYGPGVGKFLLDKTGKLDMGFQVLLNEKEWISRTKTNKPLEDGDHVKIMMLVSGG
jgi:molybdopterin converting factor small subunit